MACLVVALTAASASSAWGSVAFTAKWGGLGTAEAQFNNPLGVALDAAGNNVYVVDELNQRMQEFSIKRPRRVFQGIPDLGGYRTARPRSRSAPRAARRRAQGPGTASSTLRSEWASTPPGTCTPPSPATPGRRASRQPARSSRNGAAAGSGDGQFSVRGQLAALAQAANASPVKGLVFVKPPGTRRSFRSRKRSAARRNRRRRQAGHRQARIRQEGRRHDDRRVLRGVHFAQAKSGHVRASPSAAPSGVRTAHRRSRPAPRGARPLPGSGTATSSPADTPPPAATRRLAVDSNGNVYVTDLVERPQSQEARPRGPRSSPRGTTWHRRGSAPTTSSRPSTARQRFVDRKGTRRARSHGEQRLRTDGGMGCTGRHLRIGSSPPGCRAAVVRHRFG